MIIKTLDKGLSGYNNVENMVSELMKPCKRKRLERVEKSEKGDILLNFSDEDNYDIKTVVKQYAKRRYKDAEECIQKFKDSECHALSIQWRVISVIELPKVWLIFFERIILKE